LKYALPVARPGKIICLGLNYLEHVKEGRYADNLPKFPTLFARGLNSLVPHLQPLIRPKVSETFDYEAELVAVIGKRAKHMTLENAVSCVAGWTCCNEGSIREFQRHTTQWHMGKNFDRSGALGPSVVTADELPAGGKGLKIESRVNGKVMQSDNTANMMFPVAETIVYATQGITLEPGDLLVTGTPSGVGHARKPPAWMRNGDVCEIEIEGIGILRNPSRTKGSCHSGARALARTRNDRTLLPRDLADQLFETGELLLDQIDSALVLQLQLVVEFLPGEGDDHLGPAEQHNVDRGQRLPQVVLHACAAEETGRGRLQRHRLAGERLVLHARYPIDRVLQHAGYRPVVFGRADQHAVGGADRGGEIADRAGKAAALLDVVIVERNGIERRRRYDRHAGRRERRREPRQCGVERLLAQRAANANHFDRIRHDHPRAALTPPPPSGELPGALIAGNARPQGWCYSSDGSFNLDVMPAKAGIQ
jgi:2-keto-4-pentenoate hydratase/2-oxohepta-3-ene-1,7-dioic acid hydratase in catechol pathway